MDELITLYQQIISERFPTVKVIHETRIAECEPHLAAVMIPDDKMAEFLQFRLTEMADKLEEDNIPVVPLSRYSVSETLKYYSDVVSCEGEEF